MTGNKNKKKPRNNINGNNTTAPKTLPKFGAALYNTLLKRNSTFIATIVIGAVVAEGVVNWAVDSAWDRANRGVCYYIIYFI